MHNPPSTQYANNAFQQQKYDKIIFNGELNIRFVFFYFLCLSFSHFLTTQIQLEFQREQMVGLFFEIVLFFIERHYSIFIHRYIPIWFKYLFWFFSCCGYLVFSSKLFWIFFCCFCSLRRTQTIAAAATITKIWIVDERNYVVCVCILFFSSNCFQYLLFIHKIQFLIWI